MSSGGEALPPAPSRSAGRAEAGGRSHGSACSEGES
jgi:hypothetical protein